MDSSGRWNSETPEPLCRVKIHVENAAGETVWYAQLPHIPQSQLIPEGDVLPSLQHVLAAVELARKRT